ncbi:DUF922 domain-containing protein [Maribacter polysiphoniae]|uniref:DUF922 domain-containing protein n=1 Tax=Maribacter polysiphoniae TaxID=429344 RepID=UPI0023559850|nr:DUF922 domain-containing protein [Maribacter polysiphoniae]
MGAVKYFLVFLTTIGLGRAQEYETIAWSPVYKLTWKDFKGEVPENDRAAAVTASGITYQFSTQGTKDAMEIDFKVTTFFYPNKSWYQPHLCDSFILGHEQLHFDISELYAQKMRERLEAANFTQNVRAEVKLIYREILEELEAYQDLYDTQTNFSRDSIQQSVWAVKIKEALRN